MTTSNSNRSLKEAAMDFLRLASSGDVRKAYELYVAQDFKHHNPYFKGNRVFINASNGRQFEI